MAAAGSSHMASLYCMNVSEKEYAITRSIDRSNHTHTYIHACAHLLCQVVMSTFTSMNAHKFRKQVN